jgi:hypothetical protein
MVTLNRIVSFVLIISLSITISVAQVDKSFSPLSQGSSEATKGIENLNFEAPNLEELIMDDEENDKNGTAYRIGQSIQTNIDLLKQGTETISTGGERIVRMVLRSASAKGLVISFDRFHIPNGGRLFFYDRELTNIVGAYTNSNNTPSGYFATELLFGDEIVIEYNEPKNTKSQAVLHISEIAYIYRGVSYLNTKSTDGFGDSDYCQVNVNCSPEGNSWQNQKRGVARILLKEGSQWFYCSGTLVNNVQQDFQPYFLTADHCGINSSVSDYSQWSFYFNFEASGCTNPTSAPAYNVMNGCSKIANGGSGATTGSDFKLLLFSSGIPLSYNVFYNGWDRQNTAWTGGVSIHHPSGDIMKISTFTGQLSTSGWNGSGYSSHWQVNWVSTLNGYGVTEGGSSGSPIFNAAGRVVGDLTGGSSYCSTPTWADYYGKFSYSWISNGTLASQRLKNWLDPGNTGAVYLDGTYQMVQIDGLDTIYCESDSVVIMIGIPSGGTFSGNGVTGSTFNPASAGAGIHTISYYSTSDSAVVQVTVLTNPSIDLGPDQTINSGQNTLLDAGAGQQSYLWSTGQTSQAISVSAAGTYSCTVSDINGCYASDDLTVNIQTGNPPSWTYNNTGTNHSILIPSFATITINGDSIDSGDYIGVFYDSLGTLACGGYTEWLGVTTSVTAWGAQTGFVDGFATNEEFKWKIWDASESVELIAIATYNTTNFVNDGLFQANGLSGISSLIVSDPNPGWYFANTGANHSVLVQNTIPITIGGVQIESGDYIGVFYDSLGILACGGYIKWENNAAAVTAWGAQTGMIDGFAANEEFKWMLWDASDSTSYLATAVYNTSQFANAEFFTVNGLSGLAALEVPLTQTQTLNFPLGWSIFSSYIDPLQPNVDSLFQPIVNNLLIIKDGGGNVYWPPFFNGIGNLDVGEGYQINVTIVQSLNVEGFAVQPENISLLIPAGWSIVGYLRQSPGALETMWSTMLSNIMIAKTGDGLVYWPPFVNQIGSLIPGQGYQLKMSASSSLIYPSN